MKGANRIQRWLESGTLPTAIEFIVVLVGLFILFAVILYIVHIYINKDKKK